MLEELEKVGEMARPTKNNEMFRANNAKLRELVWEKKEMIIQEAARQGDGSIGGEESPPRRSRLREVEGWGAGETVG